MKKNKRSKRYSKTPLIITSYLIPLGLLASLSTLAFAPLLVMGIGLLITAVGTFCLYNLLYTEDEKETLPVPTISQPAPLQQPPAQQHPDPAPLLEKIRLLEEGAEGRERLEEEKERLIEEKSHLEEERAHLEEENKIIQEQMATLKREWQSSAGKSKEKEEEQHQLLEEHQRSIARLREEANSKEQHIQQLESRVRDLSYEIKTILKIAEQPVKTEARGEAAYIPETSPNAEVNETDFPATNREEAHIQLKRCLDIAQRITGASHLTASPRFRDMPLEHFAMDLRRLCDRLGEIRSSALFVYSPKEKKLLYINDRIKDATGLAPDRFTEAFHTLANEEFEAWKHALQQLTFQSEAHLPLPEVFGSNVDCLLGVIPTGLFRNQLIGLVYKTAKPAWAQQSR